MEKADILREIKRIAETNGGKPPGRNRFEKETGTKMSEWYPHVWLRWGDAVAEAGFAPNKLQESYDRPLLFDAYIGLAQELGRLPVDGELIRKARTDSQFPNAQTFRQRFGSKSELVRQLAQYCASKLIQDVAQMCDEYNSRKHPETTNSQRNALGFVYLMKSGRYYKIGHTNATGRREYELGIKLPNELKTIHVIKTDDPSGIEAYWHKRFDSKRVRGEWFDLDRADVAAFKRTKNIG